MDYSLSSCSVLGDSPVKNGLPCPPPGDLPNPGIELRSPALQEDSLLSEPAEKPKNTGVGSLSLLHRIFLTQESNQGLLHCKWILYQLSYGSAGKESTCNVGNLGSIPGSRRSPGEGKYYPLQYSGLENSMDHIVHGVARSQTGLNDFHSLTWGLFGRDSVDTVSVGQGPYHGSG